MNDPSVLFTVPPHVDLRAVHVRTLLVSIPGFADVGQVNRLVDEHLLDTLSHHVVAEFDADAVTDYRNQRPQITLTLDHLEDYEGPRLTLHHVVDDRATPFLLLAGSEPNLRWEQLAAAIKHIIDQTGIERVVLVHAIPMGIPHTRPVVLSRFASSSDLIPGNEPLFQQVRFMASFPVFLAHRLEQLGVAVVGLTAHVPHYLAQAEYPEAAMALIKGLGEVTGLTIPTTALAIRAGVIRAQIASEMAESEEAVALVHALEEQYDEGMRGRQNRRMLTGDQGDLPTGDDIAAEAEAFLRQHGGPAPRRGFEDGQADQGPEGPSARRGGSGAGEHDWPHRGHGEPGDSGADDEGSPDIGPYGLS